MAIHAIHIGEEEKDAIARAGARVIHNPMTNQYLGDGICDVEGLLSRGVTMGLGTDADVKPSLIDEMRAASLLQKIARSDGSALGARVAFDLGTSKGAKALGIPAGDFTPGFAADYVVLNARHVDPWSPPLNALVYRGEDAWVQATFVRRPACLCRRRFAARPQGVGGDGRRREALATLVFQGRSVYGGPMKRTFAVTASLALLLLGAAACAGGKSNNNGSSATSSTHGGASNSMQSGASNSMQSASGSMESMASQNVPNCGAVKAVWANVSSKVYHEPGDPYYGKTKHGMYLCPSQAKAEGYRAAGASKTAPQ